MQEASQQRFTESELQLIGESEDGSDNHGKGDITETWTTSLQKHLGQFSDRFPPEMNGEQSVNWVEENFKEELAQYHIKRKQFEDQQEKLKADITEIKERYARQVQEEIVKAWIKKEEEQWKKQSQELDKIRQELLIKHNMDLEEIRQIAPYPPAMKQRRHKFM